MYSIRQIDDQWEVLGADGARVGELHSTYDDALAFIATQLAAPAVALADTADVGLLAEEWTNDEGIFFSEPTGDGRDFTDCDWSWRDPAVSLMPLMLQTENDWGHFGSQLAGFITEISAPGGVGHARGRFYDSDAGRQFRDMLLGGRRFGVSVDAGRVDVTWLCTEEDEDGWCIEEQAQFTAYEVIGLTGTPFPAFARAAIVLDTATVGQSDSEPEDAGAVRAASAAPAQPALVGRRPARQTVTAAAVLTRRVATSVALASPPADWFNVAEPQLGEPFALGDLGDEWLVDQGRGHLAMPLEITEAGQVCGHLAYWGQCHVGYPGMCIEPPPSAAAYAHFHVGVVDCADGSRVPTGTLVAGCDHAATTLRAPEARDHYAHNGVGWANVRVTDGAYGPWVCGALREDVTEAQRRVLRAGALSGDWRLIGGQLELISGLAVNAPGFPIAREAVVASGLRMQPPPRVGARTEAGVMQALVAAAVVRRCPDCVRRREGTANRNGQGSAPKELKELLTISRALERRTRHLLPAAAEHAAARLRR